MLAPVRHILPLTKVRRQRLLPGVGRVLVRKGQMVSATDVLAEAALEPKHLLLDAARALGLPVSKADDHLQRRPGELVGEGDILAGPVGWAKRVLRAPHPGRVVLAGRGKILLEVETPPFQLLAGLPGVVISLIPERGAVIEATGSLVQGMWGNNRIGSGTLRARIEHPEDMLIADRLEESLRGSVLLGGFCGEADVLRAAQSLPLRGLILASMASALVPEALRASIPILVLDGFGLLPMNAAVYQLLTTNEGREIAVNAETGSPYSGQVPEIFIRLPARGDVESPPEVVSFAPGQRVRVVRAPFHGQVGTIIAIKKGLETLPSGIEALNAQVRLESGEIASLPLANLEVLV